MPLPAPRRPLLATISPWVGVGGLLLGIAVLSPPPASLALAAFGLIALGGGLSR